MLWRLFGFAVEADASGIGGSRGSMSAEAGR
jgi:hypothetical protein